jgi:hypothetical protein
MVTTFLLKTRMRDRPDIKTAIPRRRYKLGEFTVVVLAEIDSAGDVAYQYILAVVRDGDAQPGLYITAEKPSTGETTRHALSMHVIMRDGSDVLGTSERWAELDVFVADGLEAVMRILDLQDEQPYRLV